MSTDVELLRGMIDAVWEEYGDSFMSACIYENKQHFLNLMEEKATQKIKETQEAQQAEQQKKAELAAYGNCPECGKQMVKRSGPYGDFLGCSGYPRCNHKGKMRDVVIPKAVHKPTPKVQVEKRVVGLMDGPDWDDEEVQTCGDVYPQALGWGKDFY